MADVPTSSAGVLTFALLSKSSCGRMTRRLVLRCRLGVSDHPSAMRHANDWFCSTSHSAFPLLINSRAQQSPSTATSSQQHILWQLCECLILSIGRRREQSGQTQLSSSMRVDFRPPCEALSPDRRCRDKLLLFILYSGSMGTG